MYEKIHYFMNEKISLTTLYHLLQKPNVVKVYLGPPYTLKIFNEDKEHDPLMLKFILDQLMTQDMWKNALDRCPFILKYFLEKYKTCNMFKKFADTFPVVLCSGLVCYI